MAWALAAASVVWLLLLTAVTIAPATFGPLRAVLLAAGSFICHQQPDRTFHWGVAAWPVCARCLGLYGAAPAGAIAALIAAAPRDYSPSARNFLLLCMTSIPTVATWLAEHALGWPMTNAARFAASLPLGAAVAWLLVRTLRPKYTLPDARS